MEVRSLIWMMGDGSPGDWFLAKNSSRKWSDTDPSGSDATLDGKTRRAYTLLHLWPKARATRKAVLSWFRDISQISLYGERRRTERTRQRFHVAVRRGFLAPLTDAERSWERDRPPSWRRVVWTAARWTLIHDAKGKRSMKRKAKKLATWILDDAKRKRSMKTKAKKLAIWIREG